jgi:hypothetical protein
MPALSANNDKRRRFGEPLLRPQPNLCSNDLCGISIRVSTAKQIAGKSIRPSKSSQPPGLQAALSTGGSKNASSGWAEYGARMDVNAGSKLQIFARRKRADAAGVSDCMRGCLR